MNKIVASGLGAVIGIWIIIANILALLLHVWTIIIAFSQSGLGGAVLTFMLPILSEIYWFFRSIGYTETWFNTYSIIIYITIAMYLIPIALGFLITKEKPNETQTYD